MPKIGSQPVKKKAEAKLSKAQEYARRWLCPRCKSIHHFKFIDGCHNRLCKYKGVLVERKSKQLVEK